MMIITRTMKSGKILEINCEGALLTATLDGEKVSSGGLTNIPANLTAKTAGYAMMACGNVPVTREEVRKLRSAIDSGKREINKKIAKAKAYNNLMNEGCDGYTPHAF